eukprot:COSAG03_NODE_13151_length_514_cov_5.033735_1_plen_94_part_10
MAMLRSTACAVGTLQIDTWCQCLLYAGLIHDAIRHAAVLHDQTKAFAPGTHTLSLLKLGERHPHARARAQRGTHTHTHTHTHTQRERERERERE